MPVATGPEVSDAVGIRVAGDQLKAVTVVRPNAGMTEVGDLHAVPAGLIIDVLDGKITRLFADRDHPREKERGLAAILISIAGSGSVIAVR